MSVRDERRRRDKVTQMRRCGISPFPQIALGSRMMIMELLERHGSRAEQMTDPRECVHLAGRLIARRRDAGTTYFDLRDGSGAVQLRARADIAPGEASTAGILECDVGDIVGVTGHPYIADRGDITIDVVSGSLIAKALKPPPPASDARRDGRCNLIAARARMLAAIRSWLASNGFIEVETPILQRLAGGASARPFVTHHNALDRDVFLRISSELHLRRCVAAGMERVYDLGRCFRNEGISRRHSPEFTMLEWSVAFTDYRDAADHIESLIAYVAQETLSAMPDRAGASETFSRPWRRTTLRDAVAAETGIDILDADMSELAQALPEKASARMSWAEAVLKIYSTLVEPQLESPTIVFDFPLEVLPLVKQHTRTPSLAESFDVVVRAMEIGSGASELNDPEEQWRRFVEQRRAVDSLGADTPMPHDRDFVTALEYGAPPSSGVGIGVDRLLMALTAGGAIRDVLTLPET